MRAWTPHFDHLGRWAVPARLPDDRRRIGAIVAGDVGRSEEGELRQVRCPACASLRPEGGGSPC
jgi:hypothetical protein